MQRLPHGIHGRCSGCRMAFMGDAAVEAMVTTCTSKKPKARVLPWCDCMPLE
jgi:hypothetical protein